MAISRGLIFAGLAAAGLFAFGGGGGESPSVDPRGPVDLPGSENLPWPTIDAAICAIYDGGTKDGTGLIAQLWARTYPGRAYPPVPGRAHATQLAAYQSLAGRVSTILQRTPVCGDEGPEAPPPPAGDNETDVPGTPEERAALITEWTTGREDGFSQIAGGQTLTSNARNAYGVPNVAQTLRSLLRCQVQCVYNLVRYGVPESGNDYGHGAHDGKWYSLRPSVQPRNEDTIARVLADERVRRTVGWTTGNATGNGFRFGLIWNPHVARAGNVIACNGDIFDPERNPPASVLGSMGWTLEQLREQFEQNLA